VIELPGHVNMESNETSLIDIEKYKHELNSLRRVNTQLINFRKWLVNASLASLAFTFTLLIQFKSNGVLPNAGLAAFTTGFLIAATVCALVIRIRYEVIGFAVDSFGFFALLPKFKEVITSSPEITEHEKKKAYDNLDALIETSKKLNTGENSSSLYTEVWLLPFSSLLLGIGLVLLIIYVCVYLFA